MDIKEEMGKYIPSSIYVRYLYKKYMGKRLDLSNPKTFNEKLQWLKLYDHNPKYPMLVDKNESKKEVARKIGEQHIIPTIGVWNRFEDIPFGEFPDRFILKTTHDSGSVVICKDIKSFDYENARRIITDSLNNDYYLKGREWPYKNIARRIIAEAYMCDDSSIDLEQQELTDYKFYCFNGYVDCVMICFDRKSGDTKFYFFDRDWNLKRINKRGKAAPKNFTLPKPQCLDEMFRIASELSKGIPFVRVDLYQSNGEVYFGEMTFYPQSGFDPNYLPETDLYFGKMIDLKCAYNQ